MAKKIFKEKNRFNDKIVLILLGVGSIGAFFGMIKSFLDSQSPYSKVFAYLFVALVLGMLIWWFRQLQLKVSVSKKRIKYKMSPFHSKYRSIPWEEVEKCEIVRTPAAAQWHGSNLRFSGERWFSLTGRNGISLTTKNGQRYFIGCKNIDKLKEALKAASLT